MSGRKGLPGIWYTLLRYVTLTVMHIICLADAVLLMTSDVERVTVGLHQAPQDGALACCGNSKGLDPASSLLFH